MPGQSDAIRAPTTSASLDELDRRPVQTLRARTWALLRRNPTFWLGAALTGGIVMAAALAPVLAPHDPLQQFRDAISATGDPAGPSERFPLGTDRHGRDYLSRLLYGARTSLLIGIGATLIATVIGLVVGATAALAGSPTVPIGARRRIVIPVESVLMRLTDLWLSVPILLLTITVAFVVGASVGLVVSSSG